MLKIFFNVLVLNFREAETRNMFWFFLSDFKMRVVANLSVL